jgi:tetratricopeptide (TPR) repeat protein
MQVTDADTGALLLRTAARPAVRGEGRRAFAATLDVGVLPPGEYEARALLSVPGVPETIIDRAFLLSPRRLPTLDPAIDLSAPLDPDAPRATAAPPRIIPPVPAFAAQAVLAPEVLRPFLDGLAALHPPSTPEVAALIDQARRGVFGAPEIQGATLDDRASMAFVRGLQAYQKGDVARAAAWFRQTMRDASDFMGAAFYLGASHAAGGRDAEAVAAWEMALLSENPGAVYPPLVDALLRLGDGREAASVLGEAPDAWTLASARLRREATAEAMLGAYDTALPKLQQLLGTQEGDQNLLFLAVQVLYRLHAEGSGLTASQQALFDDYVRRHQELGGPNVALVEAWRKFVRP